MVMKMGEKSLPSRYKTVRLRLSQVEILEDIMKEMGYSHYYEAINYVLRHYAINKAFMERLGVSDVDTYVEILDKHLPRDKKEMALELSKEFLKKLEQLGVGEEILGALGLAFDAIFEDGETRWLIDAVKFNYLLNSK